MKMVTVQASCRLVAKQLKEKRKEGKDKREEVRKGKERTARELVQ